MMRTITTAVIDCDVPGCDETFMDRIDLNESGAHHLALLHGWTCRKFSDSVLRAKYGFGDNEEKRKQYFCPKHSETDPCHANSPPRDTQ